MENNIQHTEPALIVGIGASTGTYEALKQFFQVVPLNPGMTFIVAQQQSSHQSRLTAILGLNAAIKIVEAKSGTRIEPNHAYIAPEGCCVQVKNHAIRIARPSNKFGSKTVIDDLFRSLAKSYGAQSACIVLSGSGSDGTAGLRALKAAGGLAIVQDPKTADYPAMPISVINANAADRVLPIEDIPPLLLGYAQFPPIELNGAHSSSGLRTVAALLKTRDNFDLNQYKESTVQRRICRRMCLTNQHTLDQYVALLREQEQERQHLMHDLLINVTDFFRDREAFKELENLAVSDIVQRAETGSTIRVWVSGCASGEEAYSIAILFLESIERFGRELGLRVFATDVDEEAISIARQGVYPISIVSELPASYINKYFMPLNENYFLVQPHLRDCISFATQNVCSDPPFSRIDLISCRNLLIYLRREAQEQVFKSFYFALKTHGYLFLGSSESTGSQQTMFKTLSQKGRIYLKNENSLNQTIRPRSLGFDYLRNRNVRRPDTSQANVSNPAASAREAILKTVGPSVLIDADNRVVYTHGKVDGFMHIPEGEARLDFIRMIDPELRTRLRSGIFKARKSDSKVIIHSPRSFLERKFNQSPLEITIYPVRQDNLDEGALLIRFEEQAGNVEVTREHNLSSNDQETMIEAIERELKETRQELQNTVEELETNTEELKSAHEEALSTNEELQSANEELEASTEELRSLNEELTTVNTQLKEKILELELAHNDIENFFESTNLATLFLDSNLRIKRHTPAAERLLDLNSEDIGRSIFDIKRRLINDETIIDAKKVLENFEAIEKEITTENNAWYQRKILPYRTAERRIDGVVITFNDITTLRQTANRLSFRERQHAMVAKLGIEALSSDNIDKFMDQIVRDVVSILDVEMCKITRYRPAQNDLMLVAGRGWKKGIVPYETTIPADLASQSGFTLRERSAVIVEDLNEEKRFNGPQLLLDHGIVSGISCVIESRRHPYGVIGVHTKSKRIFTTDDANFLCSVANLLSIAIQRIQSEHKLRESEERLTLAREAANIGIHDHDLKTNIIKWDSRVCEIMGVETSAFPVTFDVFEQCIHPEDRDQVKAAIDNLTRNPKNHGVKMEYRVLNQLDCSVRWIEASSKVFYTNGDAARIVGTIQDVTQRKTIEINLFESEQKLRIAKDSNRFGAYVYHIQSGHLEWDRILKDIWGYDRKETLDIEAFYGGLHPEDVDRVRDSVNASLDPGSDGHIRNIYRVINKKTSELKWVEASGQIIFEKNVPVKMIGMIIDITDSKELEESLQVAVDKLARENDRKNEFIATLGHELRNPLAAVNSGLQIMQLGTGDTKWALSMMSNNIKLICSLLDDLLDLTRISLGRIQLKKTSVDLTWLIRASRETFLTHATEKNQTLEYSLGDETVYVHGDETRLEQVFGNIISNALKFTPEGGTVRVSMTCREGIATIMVEDTGIGIPGDKLSVVFEPFEQISHGAVHNPGLGIGLSLVQRFVEMHGGIARAESGGKNQGSRFIVTLPIQQQTKQEKKPLQLPSLKEQLKVLIVDDNEDAARGLEAMLNMQGCQVATAYTARTTLEKVNSFEPEVFILDIGLPDMNGYDLLQELKNIYNRNALYIALTGFTQSASDAKKRAEQFDHYHTKPADFTELLNILSTVE